MEDKYEQQLKKNMERYKQNREARMMQMKKYWKDNNDKMKKYKREYYKLNKQDIKMKSKEYRIENKDDVKKYNKLYWEKNKEKLKQQNSERNRKSWKLRTPQEKEEYNINKNIWDKNKKKININYAMKKRLRLRVWQAFNGIRKKTSDELGINYDAIIKHLNKTLPIDYKSNPSKYEIDHIIPLCSFNLINQEDVTKAFAPENHRWLLAEENLKKAKEDVEYKKQKIEERKRNGN